jgi:hypothetical protein
VSLSDSIWGRL